MFLLTLPVNGDVMRAPVAVSVVGATRFTNASAARQPTVMLYDILF